MARLMEGCVRRQHSEKRPGLESDWSPLMGCINHHTKFIHLSFLIYTWDKTIDFKMS